MAMILPSGKLLAPCPVCHRRLKMRATAAHGHVIPPHKTHTQAAHRHGGSWCPGGLQKLRAQAVTEEAGR